MSSGSGAAPGVSARCASATTLIPIVGSSLITTWFGSASAKPKPSLGGRLKTRRTSVCVVGSRLPVRMKNGTPDQRQFSISSRSAAYVSVVESAATPSIPR